MGLEPADARLASGDHELDRLADGQAAVDQRPGDHGPEPGHREGPVDRQPGTAEVGLGGRLLEQSRHELFQLGEAVPGHGRDCDDGGAVEGRPGQHVFDLGLHQREPVLLHEIALRDGDQSPPYAQEVEDCEMLPGLGHDRLVGCNDEKGQVDPAHAGEHVVHEPLVARHVDDADLVAPRQRQPGESQVYRHAPGLLFSEPVRVDSGQRLDQGGLAVVDVSCGANDVHSEALR